MTKKILKMKTRKNRNTKRDQKKRDKPQYPGDRK